MVIPSEIKTNKINLLNWSTSREDLTCQKSRVDPSTNRGRQEQKSSEVTTSLVKHRLDKSNSSIFSPKNVRALGLSAKFCITIDVLFDCTPEKGTNFQPVCRCYVALA